MSRSTRLWMMLMTAAILLGATGVTAATKSAPAKKPVVKKPAPKPASNHATAGTTQLKGEYANFGSTYTLGKEYPLNITLKSAEYSLGPVIIGEKTYVPTADEKLLILHMTYHNPQPQECFVRWDTFTFTVVDPGDQNHDGLIDLGVEKDKSSCSMSFKPAQKVDVFGVMAVPAAKEMPKLIIKSSDELVLRYNLKGKVNGLPQGFANPSDKTGATAYAEVPAKPGAYYPLGMLEVKVNSLESNDKSEMGELQLEDGEKFVIVNMDVKNVSTTEQFVRWDTFNPVIIDTDGVEAASCSDMFQKSKDKSFSANLKPGQEVSVRCVFTPSDDTDVQTLSLRLDEGRLFLFDVGKAQ